MTDKPVKTTKVVRIHGDQFALLTARVSLGMLRSLRQDFINAGLTCLCGRQPFNDIDDPCPMCTLELNANYYEALVSKLDQHYRNELPAALRELYGEKAPEPIVKALQTSDDDPNYEECDE